MAFPLKDYIRTRILPLGDMGIQREPNRPFILPDDVPPVLAIGVAIGPDSPHLLKGTANGALYTVPSPLDPDTSPSSALIQLIALRTDTATVTLGPFTSGGYLNAVFMLYVTAVSGSTPTLIPSVNVEDHAGRPYALSAGSQVTGLASEPVLVGVGTGKSVLFDPFYFKVTIGGTTPSFTWGCDVLYH